MLEANGTASLCRRGKHTLDRRQMGQSTRASQVKSGHVANYESVGYDGQAWPQQRRKPPTSPCGQCQWELHIQDCQIFQHVQRCQSAIFCLSPKARNPGFYVTILNWWMFVMNSTFLRLQRLNKIPAKYGNLSHWFITEKTRALDTPGNKVQQNDLLAV